MLLFDSFPPPTCHVVEAFNGFPPFHGGRWGSSDRWTMCLRCDCLQFVFVSTLSHVREIFFAGFFCNSRLALLTRSGLLCVGLSTFWVSSSISQTLRVKATIRGTIPSHSCRCVIVFSIPMFTLRYEGIPFIAGTVHVH